MEAGTSQDTFYLIAYSLGAVQGIFLAAILIARDGSDVAARFLAAMMAMFSFDLAMAVYHASSFDSQFPTLIGLDYPVAFLYAPLLFLYARTLSNQPPGQLVRSWYLHLIPFAVATLITLPFLVTPGAERLAYIEGSPTSLNAEVWSTIFRYGNHLKLLHAVIYLSATFVVIRNHRRHVKENYSYVEWINLMWLRNLLIGIVLLVSFTLVIYVFSLSVDSPSIGLSGSNHLDNYTLLGVAVFIYAIGFMGLRRPNVLGGTLNTVGNPSDSKSVSASDGANTNPHLVIDEKPRYSRSGMTDDLASRHFARLESLMEEQHLYRQSKLTLTDLSEAMALSPHNLTEVINTQAGKNFYDFVNGYRVDEVKTRLLDSSNDHLTILAVGLEAGFNSKSSFNAVFKRHTGQTPSQFRKTAIAT